MVKKEILENNADCIVFVSKLDLNSVKSIEKFVDYVNSNFRKVFALINNAGVFYHPQQLTPDGFDLTLQTNYIGMSGLGFSVIYKLCLQGRLSLPVVYYQEVHYSHQWFAV